MIMALKINLSCNYNCSSLWCKSKAYEIPTNNVCDICRC